jgi:hypothetical protein
MCHARHHCVSETTLINPQMAGIMKRNTPLVGQPVKTRTDQASRIAKHQAKHKPTPFINRLTHSHAAPEKQVDQRMLVSIHIHVMCPRSLLFSLASALSSHQMLVLLHIHQLSESVGYQKMQKLKTPEGLDFPAFPMSQ